MAKHKPQKESLAPRGQGTAGRMTPVPPADFDEVLRLIDAARTRALATVNQELVGLYWQIGEYISRKLESAAWGEGVVEQLADHIARTHPDFKGFTRPNLFRMRQFYETYRGDEKVSPLVRQLPWTHNLLILSRAKRAEEREFYLRMALRERWSKRELERQLAGALFERVVLSPAKVSPPATQLHPDAATVFKDTYLLDFLNLPAAHSEDDLQRALVANLRQFLLELGADFAFVGETYRLQVGGRDFFVDLLFYHRGLKRTVMDVSWVRDIDGQCREAGVPHYFKQAYAGERGVPSTTPLLDGRVVQQFPAPPAGRHEPARDATS
jgi:predicted nuclease of restriction endonuclease-like (RecB) superfamily